MSDWITLLSAFGVGAIVSTLVQAFLNAKTTEKALKFSEKKEAYIGLLEALLEVSVHQTDASRMNFAYWQIRCEIVGSVDVARAIRELKESSSNTKAREAAEENLKLAFRRDLGVFPH